MQVCVFSFLFVRHIPNLQLFFLWHKEVLSKRDDNYSSGIDPMYDWEQAKRIQRKASE